jgi:ankyrin repeat protein
MGVPFERKFDMTEEQIQIHKQLRSAIKQGDIETFVTVIGSDKGRLTMMTPFGTCLHVAASFGKLDIVKRLVEMGADVNAYGGTADGGPLHRAASDGHLDVVQYLLGRGAALDVSEPERNPLFGAIYGGHTAIAKLLVDSGIDTKISYTGEWMKNMDALAFAREWGRTDIAELLVKKSS